MNLYFQKNYFILTILLFLIEGFIAIFVRDSFVRPVVGDFLVVILIYCFLQTFLKAKVLTLGIAVLIFAYLVEFSQYFKLIYILGLQDSITARLIMGNTFQWEDLVAYTLGVLLTIGIEKLRGNDK
jgi:hypothetical protein